MPSPGLNLRLRSASRKITPRICAPASFKVKYRWPVFHTRQFDSSPSTQIAKNSVSIRSRTRTVSSVTERTRRADTGVGSAGASSSSSSNGRSNRSDMWAGGSPRGLEVGHRRPEVFEIVNAEAQSLDLGRAAGLRVRLDNHRVQTGIGGRGLELGGQRIEEPTERRLDLDADDRIVRARHADIRENGGALRQ